jgi:hypothetical protein
MSIGDGSQRLHIGGNSKRMDHEDGARAGRNRAIHCLRVEVQGNGVDLSKHWRGTHVMHDVGDGQKSERGQNHFVPGTDAEGKQSEMEGGGSGTDHDRVRHRVIAGKLGLKGREFGAHAELGRAQHDSNRRNFLFADIGRR